MIGDVQSGDHVDVFYAMGTSGPTTGGQDRSVVVTLMRDLLVLRAPKSAKASGAAGGTSTQEVVVRASDTQAEKLAFASDNGKIWLVLRPKIGATDRRSAPVDQRSLLISAAGLTIAPRSGR
jgi:Flp pilus assembly protein CpaB